MRVRCADPRQIRRRLAVHGPGAALALSTSDGYSLAARDGNLMSTFASKSGLAIIAAVLCLGAQQANAQAGPVRYWTPRQSTAAMIARPDLLAKVDIRLPSRAAKLYPSDVDNASAAPGP